ncbi:hypothetical protein [Sphingomonas oryzagri]
MKQDLVDALARLTDWRSNYCAGSVIDARSGLTADDIDTILANGDAITHIGEAVEHSLDA